MSTKNWRWDIDVNWSKNWNELVELAPGVNVWQLNASNTIGSKVFIYAYPGGELGRIYGYGLQTAPEGAFYYDADGRKVDCSGQHIVDAATGNPVLDATNLKDLGSIYPQWKAGLTTSLRYKGLTLTASFAASYGGRAYSLTNSILSYMGKLTNSLEGRYDGLVHPGVNVSADGVYSPNSTITTDAVDYYNTVIYPRGNTESNVFDTSYLKLKELRVEYLLPRSLWRQDEGVPERFAVVFRDQCVLHHQFPAVRPRGGLALRLVALPRRGDGRLSDDPFLRIQPETRILKQTQP